MKIILTTDKNAKVEMYIKEEMDKIMEVIKNSIAVAIPGIEPSPVDNKAYICIIYPNRK